MKTLKFFLLPVLESLELGWQVIRYALIFVSAFFRQRASGRLGGSFTFVTAVVLTEQCEPTPGIH
jgi:hypothetical protein